MELSSHPTARRMREKGDRTAPSVDAAELRALCLEAGAADGGFVGIDRPEVADQRAEALAALPGARTLIAYVVRMNPSSIRAPARSIASLEFHHTIDESDVVGRRIVQALIDRGYRAVSSDAEDHARRRFPNKPLRQVRGRLRAGSIEGLIRGMPVTFQRGRAEGLAARYHFSCRGQEEADVSVDIRDNAIRVERGLVGDPDLRVTADAATWLGLIRGERSVLWALLTWRVRVRGRGPIGLLRRFGRCFPS